MVASSQSQVTYRNETGHYVAIVVTILACITGILWWFSTLSIPFLAISGDDFHRTLFAWEVSQGNLVPSPNWPPLQFWLEAIVYKLSSNLLRAPIVVNILSSALALFGMALWVRLLVRDLMFVLLSIVIVALLPWFIWLSVSGLVEPLAFCGIVWCYCGVSYWRTTKREMWLWIASVGFAIAAYTRFDSWGHGVPFTLLIAWYWLRNPQTRSWRWLAAAALPWVLPFTWLVYQWRDFGNPFHFSGVIQRYYIQTHAVLPSFSERLLAQPKDLWYVGTFLVPLGLWGFWLARKRPEMLMIVAMWTASLLMLISSTLSFTISNNNPQRMVVVHVIALVPFALFAVQQMIQRKQYWIAGIMALLIAYAVVVPLRTIPNYPSILKQDIVDVQTELSELRKQGVLQAGDRILIEVRIWEYLFLHLFSGDPGVVIYDRDPTFKVVNQERIFDEVNNPSLLALPPEQLQDALREQNVRVIVTYTERAQQNLAPISTETMHSDRFRVHVFDK